LEIIEHNGLYWNFCNTSLNFPNLLEIGDTSICSNLSLKVVILDKVKTLLPWAFNNCGALRFV
jgi:hypothetical protein